MRLRQFDPKYALCAFVGYSIALSAVASLSASIVSCSSTAKKIPAEAAAKDQEKVLQGLPAIARAEGKTGYKLPPFEERKLANGLTVLLVPDQKLPYISLSLLIRAGSIQDPEGLTGLSSMVAELIDKGTKKRSAPQIAAELGQLGAELDATSSIEHTLISASSLSMQADALLKNVLEIVTEPTFSEKEIDRIRKQMLTMIDRRVDSPDAYTQLAFNAFLFGRHPYARPASGNQKSVMAIKKKHIIQHYLRHYRPNNAILAVVGKYTPELIEKVEKGFGAWQAREVPKSQFPEVEPIKGVQIELVDKPGLVQSQIRLGHLGIKRQNEDFVALRLANTILGGAFSSRLNDRLRKQLGLTYSTSSMFDARLDRGPFEIATFTKNNSAGQAVSEALKVLSEFREGGVKPIEVEMAKGYLKGVFPTAIETAEKLAFNLMLLRFHGISDGYLTSYLNEVDRLSVGDVNRVIKKYFDDKNLKVVVFSTASEVAPQLQPIAKSYGGELLVKKASEIQ